MNKYVGVFLNEVKAHAFDELVKMVTEDKCDGNDTIVSVYAYDSLIKFLESKTIGKEDV